MRSKLTTQRVLSDIRMVARAGLDIDTFLQEAVKSIQRAVPHVGSCMATVDPSTLLLTGPRKYGVLEGRDEHDHQFGLLEYGEDETTDFRTLARSEVPAAGLQLLAASGQHSRRMNEFMTPLFGFTDELRVVFRDHGQVWGGASLFRDPDMGGFDRGEIDFMAQLSSIMCIGVRAGLLTRLACEPVMAPSGPAVVIVGAGGTLQQMSAGAEERLAQLIASSTQVEESDVISSLVAAARRFAAGEVLKPPRCRIRTRSGLWLVLHASPLSPRGGAPGDVAVTIDEARPPEIVPLVVAAFDLTQRERDVTQLVLQGLDTKQIAATLHVSAYTVQDHLKSVFEKTELRSRRELIARIFFDQYVPRMGTDVGPDGWFVGA